MGEKHFFPNLIKGQMGNSRKRCPEDIKRPLLDLVCPCGIPLKMNHFGTQNGGNPCQKPVFSMGLWPTWETQTKDSWPIFGAL